MPRVLLLVCPAVPGLEGSVTALSGTALFSVHKAPFCRNWHSTHSFRSVASPDALHSGGFLA